MVCCAGHRDVLCLSQVGFVLLPLTFAVIWAFATACIRRGGCSTTSSILRVHFDLQHQTLNMTLPAAFCPPPKNLNSSSVRFIFFRCCMFILPYGEVLQLVAIGGPHEEAFIYSSFLCVCLVSFQSEGKKGFRA